MATIEDGYISADGHFVEPADLWTTRMDKRFRDRAPRVEAREDADWYIIDGVTPFPVGLIRILTMSRCGRHWRPSGNPCRSI